jgi:hypothetical protein
MIAPGTAEVKDGDAQRASALATACLGPAGSPGVDIKAVKGQGSGADIGIVTAPSRTR